MKAHLTLAVLLLSGVVHTPSLAQEQSGLSRFDNFRSYPYLDRAYRAAEEQRWTDVQRLMEHLLKRVPGSLEAHRLLARSLMEQGDLDGALDTLNGLDINISSAQKLTLQLSWINAGKATASQARQWASETTGSGRKRLWQAEAEHLRQSRGTAAAMDWLSGIAERGSDLPLDRYLATLAESTQDWPTVVSSLEPHAASGKLNDVDWQRLTSGLVATSDAAGLDRLLASMPEHRQSVALNEAAQRAIALGHPEIAGRWLKELERRGELDATGRSMLLETAFEAQDTETVHDLAMRSTENCLRATVWLADQAPGMAREVLAHCPPGTHIDPETWLNLASQLGATELIERMPLPRDLNNRRTMVLVQENERQGNWRAALAWLQDVPPSPERWQLEAELASRAGDAQRAARAWQTHYRLTGAPQSLDTASHQLVESGQQQQALELLRTAFQQHPDRLNSNSLTRLAELFRQAPASLDAATLAALNARLAPEQRPSLIESLAYAERCDLVTAQANALNPPAWRALAVCAGDHPDEAVALWQKALEQSLVEGNTDVIETDRRALAYALGNAGKAEDAWQQWQQLPWPHLDSDAREAASRSALAVGAAEDAWTIWQSLDTSDSRIQLLGARIALARGEDERAIALARDAAESSSNTSDAAEYLTEASAIAANAGDPLLATQWLEQAHRLTPDSPSLTRQLGMTLANSEDAATRQRAVTLLEQSRQDYPEDYLTTGTLANLEVALGNYANARQWLRRSIDQQSEASTISDADSREMANRLYAQRRAHESLSRRDTIRLSSSWAPTQPSAGIYNDDGGDNGGAINTQILEWEHALGREPWSRGRQLAMYGRTIVGGDDRHSYADSQSLGLGLRARPFASHNLNLYAELYADHDYASDDTDVDLMLRANTSLLDQGDYSSEWRPSTNHWNERSLYLDTAWWVHRDAAQLYARYQQGHTFKLHTSSAQTLMPYIAAQYTLQNNADWDDQQDDSRLAAGLRWQLWYDEDQYNAWRRRLTISTEYQHSFTGDLYGGEHGWAVSLELSL
ncbi:NfrA family protein [Halomonas huangheensis]|uniref:Bacteriophage N4 adsorption protein A C-terminal domain-containing protein n=1 Tax=Halomonas huangheensis TaxID=1178482 RepID=W1N9F7_9GAMM|nr:tetratricopeptide repeat protein [Halomonas huangheensis]ALM53296.1 hypothetical protein AR456_14165 [Halomonas huangheensis]ERL51560.1 hypothetical protein BJB45_12960 [Halomonas huangheensis]